MLSVTTPGETQIEMSRDFHAPRALVFRALTEPVLVQQWLLGPDGWTMPVCEIDLRVGGRYRYVWSHPDGRELAEGGEFREIDRPERMVFTERFDAPYDMGEAVNTTTLIEHDQRTTMRVVLECGSTESRDAAIASGMADGAGQSYDRLDQVLGSLAEGGG